jgi:hypothetical protein
MVYPPGQGKSGPYLMQLWRKYLEQYAGNDGKVEDQIVIGSFYSAEAFGFLSLTLDREGKFKDLIEQRIRYFAEGSKRARIFGDHLVNATFGIYNHLNTLCRQFGSGSPPALDLIEKIDEQVHHRIESADQIESAAAAIRAAFPLLSLMTLVLDRGESLTPAIRQVEQRFSAGASKSKSNWEHLLNSLYRMVEMMQLFVVLSDADLRSQVDQIAARFEEEDQPADPRLKLRNGFCRLFELTHLLTTHLDEILV